MPLKSRKQVVLLGLEDTPGEEQTLSASTHAIRCENLQASVEIKTITTNEYSNVLDKSKDIVGGSTGSVSFDVLLKGSGVAGTAPEYGAALRACGFSETIIASAIPASAEAAAAGTASSLTLSSGATGTLDLYNGMPLLLGTNPAGGDTSLILGYSASKVASLIDTYDADLDDSTTYQIPLSVTYRLASDAIPSVTIYCYKDGKLRKFVGCRGNVDFEMVAGEIARAKFSFQGAWLSDTDATLVDPSYDDVIAPVWKSGKFNIDGASAAVNQVSINLGNSIFFTPNPNAVEGVDLADITERSISGSFDPNEDLVANQTILQDCKNGVESAAGLIIGITVGNRLGITMPENRYMDANNNNDRSGTAVLDVQFQCGDRENGMTLTIF